MNSALVNDLVHSFCFAARTHCRDLPLVVLGYEPHRGREIWPPSKEDCTFILPFAVYAFKHATGLVEATRLLYVMSGYCRILSAAERALAHQVMEKYYGVRH